MRGSLSAGAHVGATWGWRLSAPAQLGAAEGGVTDHAPKGQPCPRRPHPSRVVARPSLPFPLVHPVIAIVSAHVWNVEEFCKAGARNHSPATSPLPAAPLSLCDRTQSVELTQGLCLHVTTPSGCPVLGTGVPCPRYTSCLVLGPSHGQH